VSLGSLAPGDLNIADRKTMTEFGIPPDRYFAVLRRESPLHWNPRDLFDP
jgi:soluble lytic murein transglycosylase-like protein